MAKTNVPPPPTAVAIPPGFDRYLTTRVTPPVESGGVPYIGFVEPKSGKYSDQLAAMPGAQNGTPFVCNNGTYLKLSPMEFHVADIKQYWTERDMSGKLVTASADNPGDWKSPLKEEFVALVIVHTPDGPVAATATFRSTKAKIGCVANKELLDVTQPQWGTRSPDHKAAAAVPIPFGRFTVSATTEKDTAKGSGLPFYRGVATAKPVTAAKAQAVAKYFETEEGRKQFFAAESTFAARVGEIEALLA